MAKNDLSKRFLLGVNNSSVFVPSTPEYEFFIGIPMRQKQLVNLAQAQLSIQNDVANSLDESNKIISNEIRQFSNELEWVIIDLSMTVSQVGENIVRAIDDSAEKTLAVKGWDWLGIQPNSQTIAKFGEK